MRSPTPPPAGLEELRAAVKAFAERPGPARFHRVVRLLDRVEARPPRRRGRPDRDLPL